MLKNIFASKELFTFNTKDFGLGIGMGALLYCVYTEYLYLKNTHIENSNKINVLINSKLSTDKLIEDKFNNCVGALNKSNVIGSSTCSTLGFSEINNHFQNGLGLGLGLGQDNNGRDVYGRDMAGHWNNNPHRNEVENMPRIVPAHVPLIPVQLGPLGPAQASVKKIGLIHKTVNIVKNCVQKIKDYMYVEPVVEVAAVADVAKTKNQKLYEQLVNQNTIELARALEAAQLQPQIKAEAKAKPTVHYINFGEGEFEIPANPNPIWANNGLNGPNLFNNQEQGHENEPEPF